jgi:NADPH:quinone reductase-like Zn-dependent oxidoreductase
MDDVRGSFRKYVTGAALSRDRCSWDFAGVAETATADGSRPRPGTRVVGILPSGAWAEQVNCRSHAVAALPDAVGDVEEATLPVAGLAALHAFAALIARSARRCTACSNTLGRGRVKPWG